MHHEEVEAEPRQRKLQPDLGRGEPVLLPAAIQHHLQGADAQGQDEEAGPVEGRGDAALFILQEEPEPRNGQRAKRQVDEEHPAPVIDLREIAPERRPQNGPDHDSHAPDRHGGAALFGGVEIHDGGLRERHERGAKNALQEPEGHHLRQGLRHAAQHGGEGEAQQAGDEEILAAETPCKPAHRRGHDGGGDDIGGEHPGDLVRRRQQGALHIGERHIGDGGVQRLHQRRHHGADGDQGPMFVTGARGRLSADRCC